MDELLSPPLEDLDHVRGEPGAPLQLVMFGDFQCPFCLGSQSILRRVRERLGERLLFAFRHLPIPEKHPLAMLEAEASEAAAAQGKFWEYYDALYAIQPKLSHETMLEAAADLGLDEALEAAELQPPDAQRSAPPWPSLSLPRPSGTAGASPSRKPAPSCR